ncbi:MAG: histidine ammonia-lyase [Bacteroidota bacterium]|nr:histidine ammonia-lyase [Bacteroidota bacterium]
MLKVGDFLNIENVRHFIDSQEKLEIGENNILKVNECFQFLQNKINQSEQLIYGVNTGFGSLCNTKVENKDIQELQYNLLRSHACGTGDFVPRNIVKLMLLLKAQSLSYGYSGVQLSTIQGLIDLYNHNIIPVVYEQGSLGASGDLAPLAHLCLPLIGEGLVWENDKMIDAKIALNKHGLNPIQLNAKEGLALINGTQFMSAYGLHIMIEVQKLLNKLNLISALSIDAFDARIEPFYPYTHQIRKQKGQAIVANDLLKLLNDSQIALGEKHSVQDPYSYRCIPQVHGASIDAIQHCLSIITDEVNSVTDNPNVFVEQDLIISAGNFHGQALALSMDFAAMALSELANISERRIYKLISGERGLPAFLTNHPGLESGWMIAQYTAASIVSQNKQYCTPASVDSIVSSNGQEDHVSMGSNAATKLLKVLKNTQQVLAIETLVASKAINYRRPLKSSKEVETFVFEFKEQIKISDHDQILSTLMIKAKEYLFENS